MKITNKLGLPEPLVDAASSDYNDDARTIHVTQLLKGIREVVLEKRYNDEIERDVSDMIWLIFGTAVHAILEDAEETDHQIKEARLSEQVGGLLLTGKFDLYDAKKKAVVDYKTCSIWKVRLGDVQDWKRQTLAYAWLLRRAGYPCDRAEIVALMKDHSKRQAEREADYPPHPVQVIHFEFTQKDFSDIEMFVNERMARIEYAMGQADRELPMCTLEERFNDGDKFAVMKGKNKRALRVLPSMEEAKQWMCDNVTRGGTHIEVREGEDIKCASYCAVNQFCPYWIEKRKEETA